MVISHFINVSIEILIYFLVSILCLFIGRKVLDWITPYDLNNQTSIEKNIAAGDLLTEFGLEIQAGRVNSDVNFTKLEDNAQLALGETVHFVLTKNDGIVDFR